MIQKLSSAARILWAKKSKDGELLWLPLVVHLSDSAEVAKKLWNQWLPDGVKEVIAKDLPDLECARKLFIFLAAAHDIGKATPLFQAKNSLFIPGDLDEILREKLIASGLPIKPLREFTAPNRSPHALATQLLLKRVGCSRNAAVILGSHHGKPPDTMMLTEWGISTYSENFYLNEQGRAAWTAVQDELIQYALDQAGLSIITDVSKPNLAAQVLLAGLVVMTDWIASNEGYFPYFHLEDDLRNVYAKERANIAWKRLSLPRSWPPVYQNTTVYSYPERFDFKTPNQMQSAVEQAATSVREPGILVLEAPMGSGKTEAALAAAEIFANKARRSGIFFALPTQATSNAIFTRLLKWTRHLDTEGEYSVRLAHGKAQFNQDIQMLFDGGTNIGENEADGAVLCPWFEGNKKALLADFVAGTIDQLLLSALKQKHVMLRHLGLANKVVIIDECHAYDAYMSRYLEMALRWLGSYKVPVIVLSATLPSQKRKMVIDAYLGIKSAAIPLYDPLAGKAETPSVSAEWIENRAYPLITYTDSSRIMQKAPLPEGVPREVFMEYISDDSLMDRLDEALSGGGCAGVIVNTVSRAQELASALRMRFGSDIVVLLHSRFIAPDRAIKEQQLLRELGAPGETTMRPGKRIVVGTQVLEQSLDIDFDILAASLCPMDLLLQRIGRLHRHNRIRPERLCMAVCLVMGVNDESFEPGSKSIYGEYLLMRTRAMLPLRSILLPQDIPLLVQKVYDDNIPPIPPPAGYAVAREKEFSLIKDKEKRADDFRIHGPETSLMATLAGWLDTDVPASEKHSEAAVRDSDESVEVLLIRKNKDRKLCFLPWIADGCALSAAETPDDGIAKALACQSIRLPQALCMPWKIDQTIRDLESMNSPLLAWQKSPWLRGELFLILSENGSAELNGYRMTYSREDGLIYKKECDPVD